jgi:hypothetical protein
MVATWMVQKATSICTITTSACISFIHHSIFLVSTTSNNSFHEAADAISTLILIVASLRWTTFRK